MSSSNKKNYTIGHSKTQLFKCKCGGEIGIDAEQCALAHTLPTCAGYDELDVEKLTTQPEGSIARAIYKLMAKNEA